MKFFKTLAVFLCVCLLGGCQMESLPVGDQSVESHDTISVDMSFAENVSDMFTDRDQENDYNTEECVVVRLTGDTAEANSSAVEINGSVVTLKNDTSYYVTGELKNGMIIVNPPDDSKLQIIFDNVSIHNETSAALYILSGDKVFLTLAENSENTLSNGNRFVAIDENNIDSTLFSKQDLTINGAGKLTVKSPAAHGIVSKDDLVITGGVYEINAASHGIAANDSIRIANSTLNITAGKDGLQADNDEDTEKGFIYLEDNYIDINCGGDGISASNYLQIPGGNYTIIAGGGSSVTSGSESMKGLKAVGSMSLSGGTFRINSADDGVHSNTSIVVSGGDFTISTGDDGFHADETLSVTDGKINITKCYEGLEALNVSVSGGEISLYAKDDGLNAAGGTDSSGFEGGFGGGDNFGGARPGGRPGGGRPGGAPGGSSTGNGSIVISGGKLYINAGGDGIDANGTFSITGGFTTVCGPTYGDTAILDFDKTGDITGGTFIGTGASGGMAKTFSGSTQGVIAVTVGTQTAGTAILLKDDEGNILFSYTPELPFGLVILSSSDLVKGKTYTITVGSKTSSFQAS